MPWENREAPAREFRQSNLLKLAAKTTRLKLLDEMACPVAAGRFRSAGGPGAGGFLMVPTDDTVWMEDLRFKVALARRLGGGLRPTGNGGHHRCQHTGRNGLCATVLDDNGIHAAICPVGGLIIRRHDRLVRWLHRWLSEGRVASQPRLEQVLPEENGRLDIVFQDAGSTVWVDLAVTAAGSACPRTAQTNARRDGAAARAEEQVKLSRYHARASPFVLEADGRPGSSALSLVRRYPQEAHEGHSTSPAHAWNCLSSALQTGNADAEIAAWGEKKVRDEAVKIWIP